MVKYSDYTPRTLYRRWGQPAVGSQVPNPYAAIPEKRNSPIGVGFRAPWISPLYKEQHKRQLGTRLFFEPIHPQIPCQSPQFIRYTAKRSVAVTTSMSCQARRGLVTFYHRQTHPTGKVTTLQSSILVTETNTKNLKARRRQMRILAYVKTT